MLILYLGILITALYAVTRVLAPEMLKPVVPKVPPVIPEPSSQNNELLNRINRLENLLAEKNKNITLLQTELKIFQIQVRDFDKIKILLEEELHRLKEQNRIFRSELGLPAAVPKEKSIV